MYFFFVFNHHQTSAQKINNSSLNRFGLIAGYNTTNFNFNMGFPKPDVPVAATWKGGIVLGAWMNIPLHKRFIIQPEYAFTQRRGGNKSIGANYLINYISLPVLLKYKASPLFSLLAGPQAELLINARENRNGITSSITHDVEERSIGITAGFDVQVHPFIEISARYLQGLNRIGIGQRSNVKEFKFQVVQVTVGFCF